MEMEKHPLVIYGAGGLGREMAVMVRQLEPGRRWDVAGFFDDGMRPGDCVDGIPVMGGYQELNRLAADTSVIVAIADPQVRQLLVGKLDNPRLSFPVIAHPTAILGSELNYFGRGTIITAGCILTTGIVLGEFTIVNLASTIGHDVRLGSFSTVMPGCNISGNVRTGECTLFGTGAKVLQNLTFGHHCRIGAGAVVTRSFANSVTVVGVPAREHRSRKGDG